jgi:membrane fusion protein, multidrug efflux system
MADACKMKTVPIAVLILFMLFVTGCEQKKPKGMPSFMRGTPEVAVVTMKTQSVPLVTELPGRVSAHLMAEIRPQVGGIIKKRLFTEGSDVASGDVLYEIDSAPYQATYASARAALARSEANIVSVKLKAERFRDLIAVNAVSKQEYDDVSATMKQIEADIEAGKAAVEAATINLENTKVKAPISGRVGKSAVTVGALATANQAQPFTTIQQLDPIYIDAMQSSASLLRIRQEMTSGRMKKSAANQAPVRLVLEDGSVYPIKGQMKFSDVTVDASTGSFTVRMTFPNPKGVLLPGMYVRALVQQGVTSGAILVPQQGVSRDSKGSPFVLLVDKDGKALRQMIVVDRTIDDKWLVTSGLQAGDKVIVEGSQRVRPGATVKAVPFGLAGRENGEMAKPGPDSGWKAGRGGSR